MEKFLPGRGIVWLCDKLREINHFLCDMFWQKGSTSLKAS
jgi:hypothetical protein